MAALDRAGLILGILVSSTAFVTWISENVDNIFAIPILIGGGVLIILSLLWSRISKGKPTPKYDAKKLNETIYKKLMRVTCIYNVFMFGDRLGFVIPSDEKAFHNKKGNAYIAWLMETMDIQQHNKYIAMDIAIPNLQIGEKFLKQDYNDIYRQWKEITDFVDAHNKKHEDFLDFLGKTFMEKIHDILPTYKDFATLKDKDHTDIVYLKHVVNLLNDFIQHNLRVDGKVPHYDKKRTFDCLFIHPSGTEGYWVLSHSNVNGKALLFSYSKETLDVEKIQEILNSILNEPRNSERLVESKQYDSIKLHDKIESFTDRLEKEVVHDIDSQL